MPIAILSPFSLTKSPVTTNLLFVSTCLPVLNISCEWKHIVCGLWPASSTKHHVFKVHPWSGTRPCFLPFPHMDVPCLVHHSFSDGHLSWFHLWLLCCDEYHCRCLCISSHVNVFSVLLAVSLLVELLGRMVTLHLTLWGTANLFSQWLCHFPLPLAIYKGSSVSASLSTLVTICSCCCSFGVGMRWHLTEVLVCIFQMTNDVGCLFMGLLPACLFSLEKCLLTSFAPS